MSARDQVRIGPHRKHRATTPLLFAHRGAAAELPENTLPAFTRALELGADAIETDVHLTRDGHVVVSHDARGTRAAGVRRALADARIDEVRTWDAGYGFVDAAGERPFAGRGYRMPTLADVLLELPTVRFNVDAKQRGMAAALVRLVRRLGAVDRVRIASFSSATLAEVRALGYEGETGLGRAEVAACALLPMGVLTRVPPRGDAAQVPLRAGALRFDTAAMVRRLHALGLVVHFWTVNDAATTRRLLAIGADGIMTDDPAVLGPLFRELRASTAVDPR